MTFLDTHVALWLYAEIDRIPAAVAERLDEDELFLSPMARLEMSLLYEMGRLNDEPEVVVNALGIDLELEIERSGWKRAVEIANHLAWTRDPFDRLITAHAICFSASLCTRDKRIREHYREAFWN